MRIVITGDSTASDYAPEHAPRTGWGQALAARGDLVVSNHALSGASTGSFIEAGLLDAALAELRPGDALLVCFGHNDPKPDHRYTDADTAFPANLRRFVAGARERGAVPVLLTPIERRHFVGDVLETTHGPYPDRTRTVAREDDVALIDLTLGTRRLWQSQGVEASKDSFLWLAPGEWPGYPDGEQDDTHLSAAGASLVAELVLEGLLAHGIVAVADRPDQGAEAAAAAR
ncbi:rhamnogalacturonan acetylesterase [Microbacterium sp. Sa4CUA7]|uniref:Rhamnogalacturonan acetylesterase n=1 Tax=Microbacterium pullorum TaxID=2762236 RepID=A0ABR8RZ57_9MICO|nr:rhamnogalacturonan acetylesterase [Microbacterium pullorum]MBD7956496.1 rhamnogalacturonan acetylesterase [Microbacterium pullorum]